LNQVSDSYLNLNPNPGGTYGTEITDWHTLAGGSPEYAWQSNGGHPCGGDRTTYGQGLDLFLKFKSEDDAGFFPETYTLTTCFAETNQDTMISLFRKL
jgi:hypothetical protein